MCPGYDGNALPVVFAFVFVYYRLLNSKAAAAAGTAARMSVCIRPASGSPVERKIRPMERLAGGLFASQTSVRTSQKELKASQIAVRTIQKAMKISQNSDQL